jgi:uncharacterized protein YndB with AHSA1/START domain
MSAVAGRETYGTIVEDATLKIQRVLPGPIGRVWAYLTESELRRQWLASGDMDMKVGSAFELCWRNDELTNPPGHKPDGFGEEHRMQSRITACDPPRLLAFEWGSTGGVIVELEAKGDQVLLTLTHRRVLDRAMRLNVSAGWHAHIDVLTARLSGKEPQPFWDEWLRLKGEYESRLGD